MTLSPRQKEVLTMVIQNYAKEGRPISSKSLIGAGSFFYSPATLRAEMNFLERKGLLRKPHTSAGRVPTEKGYRLYVRELMTRKELLPNEQNKIKSALQKIEQSENFPRDLADLLADLSEVMALVLRPRYKYFYFSGLDELLERIDQDMFYSIAHFLEETERDFTYFLEYSDRQPNVLIGQDHPLLRGAKCGLILSRYRKGKDQGVVALLGPDRMDYEKNISLLEYINQILD